MFSFSVESYNGSHEDEAYFQFLRENRTSPLIHNAVVTCFNNMGYSVACNENGECFVSKDGKFVIEQALTEKHLQKMCIAIEKMHENSLMKMYYFYFFSGTCCVGIGASVSDAATACGLGRGAVAHAIDFYSEGLNPIAIFDKTIKKWVLSQNQINSAAVSD